MVEGEALSVRESSKISSHKQLRVWQDAMDAAMAVFEASKQLPREETYSLVDQMRRASRSVAANVSEAWAKRRYPLAFISKLCDAQAEASETQTWIEFCLRCKYISAEQARILDDRYRVILGQILAMMARPEAWTVPK